MLTGWVCLYLFLVFVLTHGGKIQGWHGFVWGAATFAGIFVAVGGQKSVVVGQMSEDRGQQTEDGGRCTAGGRRWVLAGVLTCVGVALPTVFSWILGHFTDFSWDGMTTRGVVVWQLMQGKVGVKSLSFGHVSAGFLAEITDTWQAGKGINLTLVWICFCFVFAALQSLKFAGWRLWFLSMVTVLNPVAAYQLSSFQIDGHVASLITCLLFSMLKILGLGRIQLDGFLALAVLVVGLAASKTSGFFYAVVILVVFLFFYVWKNSKNRQEGWALVLVLALLGSLGLFTRTLGGFWKITPARLAQVTGTGPGYGVGGGASDIAAFGEMNRLEKFFFSTFSQTEISASDIRVKYPFKITRRELRVFEELTPDPRAGGFGPWYGTAFLCAGLGCLLLVFQGRVTYWPGWFLFLATAASSFGSQVWWARWTPQNWLLLTAMLMTVLACKAQAGSKGESDGEKVEKFKGLEVERLEDAKAVGLEELKSSRIDRLMGFGVRGLGGLACMTAGVNVLLVTLYYFVGMGRQERILTRQIELAKAMAVPVRIYVPVIQETHARGRSFRASSLWFRERGIKTKKLEAPPQLPRMKLNKTDTFIPLTLDWRSKLQESQDEALFRKRGLIED